MADISKEMGAAQSYVPSVADNAADAWQDQGTFDSCINHLLIRLGEDIRPTVTGDPCLPGTPPSNPLRQFPIGSLPSAQIATLKPQIDALPKALGKLEERAQTLFPRLKSSELFSVDFSEVEQRVDALTDRQDMLADVLKATQSARAALIAYRDVLDAWNLQERLAPQQMVAQSIPLTQHPVRTGTGLQKLDAKIQAQTLLTKETSDVGTVSVTWVQQRWEVSAGLMWSNVLGRSFQNAPTIVNGKPMLDSSGKQVSTVTESTTSPTIDAVVLIHYRITEWPGLWDRRFAVLGTAGVGTGANSSGVDFAAGPSFAWGNLISPRFCISPELPASRMAWEWVRISARVGLTLRPRNTGFTSSASRSPTRFPSHERRNRPLGVQYAVLTRRLYACASPIERDSGLLAVCPAFAVLCAALQRRVVRLPDVD